MFERYYLASVAVDLVDLFLNWETLGADFSTDVSTVALANSLLIVLTGFFFLILWQLWFWTARKANNIAKWIVVILFAVNVYVLTFYDFSYEDIISSFATFSIILQAAAILMLFKPDSRKWFATKGQPVDLEKIFE